VSPRTKAFGILAGLGLLGLFLSGCASRAEIVRFMDGMEHIQEDLEVLDSLSRENSESIVELRAMLVERLGTLEGRIDALNARVGDTQGQLQRMYKRIPREVPRSDSGSAGPVTPPEETYNMAYLDYAKGEFDLARREFEGFLVDHPSSELADNALYWIGECHVSLDDMESAMEAFERVVEEYPAGNKAPSALYKMGMLSVRAGRIDEAGGYFERITRAYPRSEESGLAMERLKSLRGE
jgi:tol-pal system protein YbgF